MTSPSPSFSHSQIPFYDRCGNVAVPAEGAVIRARAGIFALARAENAVLLVWPNFTKGIPDLPGGGIDEGETPDKAMRREWAEETGIPFGPMSEPYKEFRHVRGFHAEDKNEYWVYDQIFRLYDYFGDITVGARWRNPEGDQASWESLDDLPNLRLNRAHWAGVIELMPKLR